MSITVDFVLLVSGIAALVLWNEPLVTCEYENTKAKIFRTYLCLDGSKNLKHPNVNKIGI